MATSPSHRRSYRLLNGVSSGLPALIGSCRHQYTVTLSPATGALTNFAVDTESQIGTLGFSPLESDAKICGDSGCPPQAPQTVRTKSGCWRRNARLTRSRKSMIQSLIGHWFCQLVGLPAAVVNKRLSHTGGYMDMDRSKRVITHHLLDAWLPNPACDQLFS